MTGEELQTAVQLAHEGSIIQANLRRCGIQLYRLPWTLLDGSSDPGSEFHNSQNILGKIYYHTMLVYLSGMFSYNEFWARPTLSNITATLCSLEVKEHVNAITDQVEWALEHSNLAGPLFYLPLRIAGQRCQTEFECARIRALISRIAQGGFIVIRSLLEVLQRVWDSGKGGIVEKDDVDDSLPGEFHQFPQ